MLTHMFMKKPSTEPALLRRGAAAASGRPLSALSTVVEKSNQNREDNEAITVTFLNDNFLVISYGYDKISDLILTVIPLTISF